MHQILFTSINGFPGDDEVLYSILNQSRRNNETDGITGLLWSNKIHFLQVFEGPSASVLAAAQRIWSDRRHHTITVIHQIPIEHSQFGSWNNIRRRVTDAPDGHEAWMKRLLVNASSAASKRFYDMMSLPDDTGMDLGTS